MSSVGACSGEAPAPPPGGCARLATATSARRASKAAPLIASLRALLMFRTLDEHRERAALGLEDRLGDVAEVLAVDLERERPVAGDLDPVEVMPVEHVRVFDLPAAAEEVAEVARDGACGDTGRGDQVEAELEPRLGRRVNRNGPRVRVWIGIRDEDKGGAPEAADLERRLEPPACCRQHSHRGGDVGGVAGAPAVLAPAERV